MGCMTTAIKNAYAESLRNIIALLKQFDDTNEESFYVMMKFAFKGYGLSVRTFASAIKVSPSAVSKWVHGDAMPTVPTRKAVRLAVIDMLENRLEHLYADIPDSMLLQ